MAVQIQIRRDTAADWTSANPILAQGELGLEIDTARFKIGDGVLAWNSLLYANQVFSGPGAISANSSTAALRVTQIGSGAALLVEDSANPDSTPFIVDANGRVLVGTLNPTTNYQTATPQLQVHTNIASSSWSSIASFNWSNTDQGAGFAIGKSRSATVGTMGVVQSGDTIGDLIFSGDDGTNFIPAARISAIVDGTPGTNDMPGRLMFSTTADGASSPTERLRITQAGNVGIGETNPGTRLSVKSAGASGGEVAAVFQNPSTAAFSTVQISLASNGANRAQIHAQQDNTGLGGALYIHTADNAGALAVRMAVDKNGNVGIGTSSPVGQLDITASTAVAAFLRQATTDTGAANINFDKYRGTFASPTVVASGDQIGTIWFRGFDGGSLRNAAALRASVDGTPGASDMPGRLEFYTTPDGSTSLAERMRIDSAGLITGSGTSLGAWTAYTPTLGGTGWALGNGTVEGEYVQIGKIVHARGTINFNSTSTFGAGNITISLPIARANRGATPQVTLLFNDVSVSKGYLGTGYIVGNGTTATLSYLINGTNGEVGAVVSSTPFTWASLDQIFFSFTYQAA